MISPGNVVFTVDEMARGASFFRRLNERAGSLAEDVVRSILESAVDTSAAYFPCEPHIELYWVVIWIVAALSSVASKPATSGRFKTGQWLRVTSPRYHGPPSLNRLCL